MCGSAAGSRPRLLGADEGSQLTNSRETLIYNIFARVGNASGANIFVSLRGEPKPHFIGACGNLFTTIVAV